MKKLTKTFVLAVAIVSLVFTGALAGEPVEDAGKHDKIKVDKEKASRGAKQRSKRPDRGSQQAAQGEENRVINQFLQELRGAQQKYKMEQRAASKLNDEERKAATQKAREEMQASIKKAEEDRDAALMVIEPEKMKEKQRRDKEREEKKKTRAEEKKKAAASKQQAPPKKTKPNQPAD